MTVTYVSGPQPDKRYAGRSTSTRTPKTRPGNAGGGEPSGRRRRPPGRPLGQWPAGRLDHPRRRPALAPSAIPLTQAAVAAATGMTVSRSCPSRSAILGERSSLAPIARIDRGRACCPVTRRHSDSEHPDICGGTHDPAADREHRAGADPRVRGDAGLVGAGHAGVAASFTRALRAVFDAYVNADTTVGWLSIVFFASAVV